MRDNREDKIGQDPDEANEARSDPNCFYRSNETRASPISSSKFGYLPVT